ncbi:cation diffusion facilitator family transporter [Methylocystis heyeri]|uniref:Cation diffusion facilitator family transporter n=2 Tax=Methylocystis heyeri TaxID=391905 RepID=A0A6B8KI22_9HYPH|nr:cation diffusion facilitator family transporter [Methylocystis heyeri]
MTDELEFAEPSEKLGAAKASIAASAVLALAKLAAGLWSGSLSLLSEAGHAGVDTGATILTYFAVRAADKPADEEHHYGHGKIESLAALVETGLLFGLALVVVAEAVRRLGEGDHDIDAGWPVFAVLGGSILIDFVRSRQLSRIAEAEGSEALAADALHFASDLISSVLVLLGLAATHFGFVAGDAVAAFGVALFIAVAGFRLGRRTIETLLDAAPKELVPHFNQIINDVPGVIALESLRLRTVGAKVIGEASIAVSRTLSVEQAARIKALVNRAIAADSANAEITVTIEARALDDETMIERILLVAARRHLQSHHIVVQQLDEKLSISLDMEMEGELELARAHAVASEFESALRDEFGADTEIDTHLEPLAPHVLIGRDADPAMRAAVENSLQRHAAAEGAVHDVHDVRVRGTSSGLVVNYHCRFDEMLTVEAVHEALDGMERKLREEFPTILRIAGHPEPIGA